MLCEDEGPWMNGVIQEANSSGHRGRSYIIRVMKMGRKITRNMRHICSMPVTTKKHLRRDKGGNCVITGYFHAHSDSGAQQSTQVIHSRSKGTYGSWEANN